MDELKALAYFSSLTHISRKVALQEKSLIKYLGNKWTEYSPEQTEELLNDLCVPHFIRDEQPVLLADDEGVDKLPYCWPTLKLPSGEKIIVDETDIWTWQDEHSGPFSWKSKSQQDLTLLDYEPDNLTKPQGRRNHNPSESGPEPPTPHKQFTANHDSWTGAVIADYFANCKEEVQTPVHTPSDRLSPVESPTEEINQGFEGSVEDLSPKDTPVHTAASSSGDANEMVNIEGKKAGVVTLDIRDHQKYAAKAKSKGHIKTPSPKKLPHPNVVNNMRREAKTIDSSHDLLILDHKDDDSNNAFTNPVMEVQWSSFVGQSSADPGAEEKSLSQPEDPSAALSTTVKVTESSVIARKTAHQYTEPAVMEMERGCGGISGEESVESTPDHTTQLLKKAGSSSQGAAAVQLGEEKEEVVYVVEDGAGSVSVSTQMVTSSAADDEACIPQTGFDFLDNW